MSLSRFPQHKKAIYRARDDAEFFIVRRAFDDAQRAIERMKLLAFGETTVRERQTLEDMVTRIAKELDIKIVEAKNPHPPMRERRILEDLR